jgi:putative redox protein
MKVNTMWTGKRHFESIGISGTTVNIDARQEDGGEGRGNRPMELLLMGLTGCTGIDIAMILERMRQPLDSLEIEAEGIRKEDHPKAFTEIHLTYRMNGQITPDKAWRSIHLSEDKYCSASASLSARITPHLVLNGKEIPQVEHDVEVE